MTPEDAWASIEAVNERIGNSHFVNIVREGRQLGFFLDTPSYHEHSPWDRNDEFDIIRGFVDGDKVFSSVRVKR